MDEKVVQMNLFKPRDYQMGFVKAFEEGKKNRFIIIWPRRSGKDICAFNLLLRAALRRVGNYYYVWPTFSQARRGFWDTIDNDGLKVLTRYIPDDIIANKNESLMRIRLVNGSAIQLVGSDNIDNSLVGANAAGILFSEYAMQNPRVWQLCLPIVRGNAGFAMFVSTVRGKNHFWDLYNNFKNEESWFVDYKTIDDTKHIPLELIEEDIAKGAMSRPMARQEWWNNWDTGAAGSYYSEQMNDLRLSGHIGNFPYDPTLEVFTSCDIGFQDLTCYVFFQIKGNAIYIIDFYENNRQPLDHYAKVIKQKDYNYSKHFAPADISIFDQTSGQSRWQVMYDAGIKWFRPTEDDKATHRIIRSIDEGIEQVRRILPRCYFDESKCSKLLRYLENYQKDYDEKNQVYKSHPKHDINSHACFVGDTNILMSDGSEKLIKDVVIGDLVKTPFGSRRVLGLFNKKVNKINRVTSNNIILECTPEHKIFTNNGLKESDALRYNEVLNHYSKSEGFLWKLIRLFTRKESLKGFKKVCINLNVENTFSLMDFYIHGVISIMIEKLKLKIKLLVIDCIEQCGLFTMAKYLKDSIFIISTKIEDIMGLKTYSFYPNVIIYPYMHKIKIHGLSQKDVKNCSYRFNQKLKNGMQVKKGMNGISNMLTNLCQFIRELSIQRNVINVIKILWRILISSASVMLIVSNVIVILLELILLNLLALFVRVILWLISVALGRHVVKSVEALNLDQEITVYDLTIEEDNCYYANNILVSNSDAFRMLAIYLPFTSKESNAEDVRRRYNEAHFGTANSNTLFNNNFNSPFKFRR